MRLFRPVGLEELRLVYETGMKAFPPRLPEQPIFYPVLNEQYARQIAVEWNTVSGTRAGIVTAFDVEDDYVCRFEPHIVGSRVHEELWVPAGELPLFNAHIVGRIRVVGAFFGEGHAGITPSEGTLAERDAAGQFTLLAAMSVPELREEVSANAVAVFLNFLFWEQQNEGSSTLERIRAAWLHLAGEGVSLGVTVS